MRNKVLIAAVILVVATIAGAKMMRPDQKDSASSAGKPASSLQAGMPSWVLVHSTMCIPCKEMEKTAAKVMPRHEGKVRFVDVLVDRPEDQSLVKRFKVSLIPTSIFLDSSGKEVARAVGVIKEDKLHSQLAALTEES